MGGHGGRQQGERQAVAGELVGQGAQKVGGDRVRQGEPQRLRPAIVLTLLAAVLHGVLLAAAFLGIAALR